MHPPNAALAAHTLPERYYALAVPARFLSLAPTHPNTLVGEYQISYDNCPTWAPFCGYLGAAICVILANWGAAVGTYKSGMGLCRLGVVHPNGIIKNLIAIIMAGVLGIFGLIVSIIIAGR